MANCDMCGKETEALFGTLVEGVEINVCKQCSRFGKVLRQAKAPAREKPKKKAAEPAKPEEPEVIEIVVNDYAEVIKKAREKLGLKQEEVAKRLNERESLIQNIERGKFKPSMNLARKLEGFLRIKLIESFEDSKFQAEKSKSEGLTIGDLIKKKSQ